MAKQLIMQKVEEHKLREGANAAYNLRINLNAVASFVGKKFCHINDIKAQSGVDVFVDKKAGEVQGYAIVRIGSGSGAELGYQLVSERLKKLCEPFTNEAHLPEQLRSPTDLNAAMRTSPPAPGFGQAPGMPSMPPPAAGAFGGGPVCGQCGQVDSS